MMFGPEVESNPAVGAVRGLKPTVGSIVSFTPDVGWVAEFDDTEKSGTGWSEAVIGWAVVVTYVDETTPEIETQVEPVVLAEDRYPIPISEYTSPVMRDLANVEWRLVRQRA